MKSVMRRAAGLAGASMAVAAMSAAGASVAQAAESPTQGCPYPYVCFYVNWDAYYAGTPITTYRDVTSSYQTVRARPHYYVLNTRNDDVAYLRLQDGTSVCLGANSTMSFADAYSVTGIRISTSSTC